MSRIMKLKHVESLLGRQCSLVGAYYLLRQEGKERELREEAEDLEDLAGFPEDTVEGFSNELRGLGR